jgi:hypothetical protein
MGRNIKIFVTLGLLMLLPACGGTSLIKGEPPRVSISSVSRTSAGLSLQLRFRNINQEPLVISQVAFTFTLDDHPFRVSRTAMPLSIDASTSEVNAFTLTLPANIDSRLTALESGEVASLQHELEGEVIDQDGDNMDFRFEGHLYAVPGRPGQFR